MHLHLPQNPFPSPSWASIVRRSVQCVKTPIPSIHLPLLGWGELEELAGTLSTLAGVEVGALASGTSDGLRSLLDNLLALGEDELDVAWVGHVWVDL